MLVVRSSTQIILFALGFALIGIGMFLPGTAYSELLTAPDPKDLSWGPTFFRALLLFHGGVLVIAGIAWEQLTRNKFERIRIEKSDDFGKPIVFSVLFLLSVIAIVLRLWNLNTDLWIDEVLTLLDYARQPLGEIVTSFPNQNQHMLFSVMARSALEIFGESAWAMRLPSVLFGVASIWAFFFLCRRLLGSREALLCCALMTVSYHHIWFSQNARGYMGLLFFTLLAVWCWFEALETNKWRWWLAYAAAVVLGMWIHMTMAFVVAAQGLVHIALLVIPVLSGDKGISQERRASFRPFAAWLLSVTVTLQLYALSLPEFLRVGLHEESKNSEWTNPLWVIKESISGLSIGFAGMAVVLFGGAFVAFGWISLFRKNRRAAVLCVLPAILAAVTMLSLGHNLWPRFFFFSMGFGILIVIHGAVELPKFIASLLNKTVRGNSTLGSTVSRLAAPAGITFVMVMIAASIITVPRNYALPKQDFSGARDYVETHSAPSDKIVAVNLAGVMYGRYFAPEWTVAKTGPELEEIQQKNESIWLIYTIPIEIRAFSPDVWNVIQRDFEVVKVFPGTLNAGEIFVCQKRSRSEEKSESNRNISQR